MTQALTRGQEASGVADMAIPKGWLQALEFEERGIGHVSRNANGLVYVARPGHVVLLAATFANQREARSQLKAYRTSYRDMKVRRAAFRLVQGGE